MGLVAEDYADYVSNLQTPTFMVPLTPESEGDFSFRHADMSGGYGWYFHQSP
jgi:hypothetical protein